MSKKPENKIDNIHGAVGISGLKNKGKAKDIAKRTLKKLEDKVLTKEERIREYRREASRLSAMANKRVERLEKNNMQDAPAYQAYIRSGGGKFGVRGKDFNQVQAEVARLRNFLDATTSTITGIKTYLVDVAENTGIKYKDLNDLKEKAPKFFELAGKVEEYLRTVEDIASAIGYQQIWEAINTYVQAQQIELNSATTDIDGLIGKITNALTEHQKTENISTNEGGYITDSGVEKFTWFKLKKD